ncbi:MAG: hypothetical protein J4A00_05285 [Gammaproteobacteria bacterium]|nr:hypothetical protein [Gammaproteobacteria bacterium]
MSESQAKPQRKTFIALVLLFLAPLIAALVLYFGPESWYPVPITEGHLLHPAQPLEPIQFQGLDGAAAELEQFKGRWSLVYPQGRDCGPECGALLHQLVQLRVALGEDRERLNLLLVLAETPDNPAALQQLAADNPEIKVLFDSSGQGGGLLPQLGWRSGFDRIYLVDPLGNFLMYYSATDGPRPVLNDLEHLMKHSASG